jgi:hypothetical protein
VHRAPQAHGPSQITVPRGLKSGSAVAKSIPSRVLTSSRPSGALRAGAGSHEVLSPSTTSPGSAPTRAVDLAIALADRPPPLPRRRALGHAPRGARSRRRVVQSRRRFRSQGFSPSQRFPGTPGDRGLVSCRSRPWGSPFRALLLVRGRVPLSGSLAPLQFSAVVPEVRCARPHPPGFTDAHACAWWPGSSPELGRRFGRGVNRVVLDDLGLVHRAHLVPTASSASKPRSPRRVRARPRRSPVAHEPMLSWALPLQSLAPTEPRVLVPDGPFRPPRASVRDDEPVRPARRQVRAVQPRGRAGLIGARRPGATGDRACRLSTAPLPPSTLEPISRRRSTSGPRRFEGLDQRPASVRRVALLGFVASSTTSRPCASSRPWLRISPEG